MNPPKRLKTLFNSIPLSAKTEILKNQQFKNTPSAQNADVVFVKNEIRYNQFKQVMYTRQQEHRRRTIKTAVQNADKSIDMMKKFIREQFRVYSNANMGFLDVKTKSQFSQNAVDVYQIDVNPKEFYARVFQKMETDYEVYDEDYRRHITYENRKKQLDMTMMGPKPANNGEIEDIKEEFQQFYKMI
ncbi:hypothetical protein SS50377_26715 [Spironucleus salmonicida]|uniref:Uncharacterized protein n=1 Tax=Spironucleus salmonicida TaxID=348837 RepID=V6LX45_9EUKA|nr:hypothetical protein SS50377_26715 [Spironucleus salmonicida]|eukprot:EST49187.1 hypothetical protein SS50377_10402 [Spironucleus salmonicida]